MLQLRSEIFFSVFLLKNLSKYLAYAIGNVAVVVQWRLLGVQSGELTAAISSRYSSAKLLNHFYLLKLKTFKSITLNLAVLTKALQ